MRRRDLLLTAALAALPRGVLAADGTAPPQDGRLRALLGAFFEENLRLEPEAASELGLDTGTRAPLKAMLADVSHAGLQARRTVAARRLRELAALRPDALSPRGRVLLDTARYVEARTAEVAAFDFTVFDGFSPSPYALSPITGAYQGVPVFLDTKHAIADRADADAYLARLRSFARVLAQNTDRFRSAAAEGVTPPDFLLDTTLGQIRQLLAEPGEAGVVRSLDRRARERGLGEGYGRDAAAIYAGEVRPALEAQIAALEAARRTAGSEPGVWRFRGGPEFYAANLRYTTTTAMTPEEIHALGVEQARSLTAKLDGALRQAGLSEGSVSARMRALYARPDQLYPDTPAGKARLLADLQARMESVRAKLPRMFRDLPPIRTEVRAVPSAIDAGAPLAYSETQSLDGSRPGYVYFNLHDTAEWPRFDLPSTLYHEGLPGHQLQGAVALQNTDIPLYVRNLYFSGYGEGWALYAEQLADELGEYDADPLGRIGLYKALIFRAGRCIVDTGMHHLRWSRARAIETLIALDGDAPGSTTREVDRYVAIPGQACAYKIGHTTWNRLRDRARQRLGARFDIRDFHAAGLKPGALPLDVLDRVIQDWTAAKAG